jgi:hypothetical protein
LGYTVARLRRSSAATISVPLIAAATKPDNARFGDLDYSYVS